MLSDKSHISLHLQTAASGLPFLASALMLAWTLFSQPLLTGLCPGSSLFHRQSRAGGTPAASHTQKLLGMHGAGLECCGGRGLGATGPALPVEVRCLWAACLIAVQQGESCHFRNRLDKDVSGDDPALGKGLD